MLPILNWREIAELARELAPRLEGAYLDRWIVPERPSFPGGYLKSEWVLRFRESSLYLSVRPRACYVMLEAGKGPKASQQATHSPFEQSASKLLRGRKLTGVRAIPNERLLVFDFGSVGSEAAVSLVLCLIPALPEALLIETTTLRILARSRTIRDASKAVPHWSWPDPSRVPPELPLRTELVRDLETWKRVLEVGLSQEALTLRVEAALREVRTRCKALEARVRQGAEELAHAEGEAEWAQLGELLKSSLHQLPEPVEGSWLLGGVRVPCGEGRTPVQQVEKLFSQARRRRRRLEEATQRRDGALERLSKLKPALELDPSKIDWAGLQRLEKDLGLRAEAGVIEKRVTGAPSRWHGRVYFSRDGFPLLVGRTRDENLELTFKIAKGNDIWMHVRGKPGAHLVIPVPSGKSVPLETLLDAAQLVIFHSGGKGWGKTEVDYTFKKYVKRIKDSTEASYTQNKTLIIEHEEARLSRLLGQGEG